jgi:hypothetical protein
MLFNYFVGFHRSRYFAGRLTARLKGAAGQAIAWVQLITPFFITYKVQTELIRILLSYTKRKLII